MGRLSSFSAAFVVLPACVFLSAAEQRTRSVSTNRGPTTDAREDQAQTVQVELTNAIRIKKSKPGDLVKARTVTALILPNQIVIPQGSRVVGQVTQVSQVDGVEAATIGIVFDRFELKGHRALAARFSIVSAAMPQWSPPQVSPEQPNWALPTAATSGNREPPTPTPLGTGGFTDPKKSAAAAGQPWMLRPIAIPFRGDARGDLRGVPRGTLLGMPGISLRLDESSGGAHFESANRKLELKTGTQFMLEVDIVAAPLVGVGSREK